MSDLDEASKYIGKTNLTEEQKQMIINLKQAPDTIKKFAIDTGTFGGDLSKQLKNQGNFGGLDPTRRRSLFWLIFQRPERRIFRRFIVSDYCLTSSAID